MLKLNATALHIKLKWMQYHKAAVGVETGIQALHCTAMQMQWSMNKALVILHYNALHFQVKISAVLQCSSSCRDGNSNTALHCNADAVEYEWSFYVHYLKCWGCILDQCYESAIHFKFVFPKAQNIINAFAIFWMYMYNILTWYAIYLMIVYTSIMVSYTCSCMPVQCCLLKIVWH